MLTAVEVYLGDERLPLVSASADHSQKDYSVASLIDDEPGTAWAINVQPGSTVQMNAEHTVVFTLGRTIDGRAQPLRFVLKHELNNDYNVGRVQFSVAEDIADPISDPTFLAALAVEEAERSAEQKKLISSKFDAVDQPLKDARKRLDELRVRLRLGPTVKTMVMQDVTAPRTTFLLKRGDFLQPDKELGPLSANVPQAFPELRPRGDDRPFDRLDLARWLVARNHPLTAQRHRESPVDALLRSRSGRNGKRFRVPGIRAYPSRTARLAGVEPDGSRLVAQDVPSPHCHVGDVSPGIARPPGRGSGGSA